MIQCMYLDFKAKQEFSWIVSACFFKAERSTSARGYFLVLAKSSQENPTWQATQLETPMYGRAVFL